MADPGIPVQTVCSATGKTTQQNLYALPLTVGLQYPGSKKELRRHRLVMYVRGETHPLLLCASDELQPGGAAIALTVHVQKNTPLSALMLRWYAEVYDVADGLWAQELIGCGMGTSVIRMFDIDGTAIGRVVVHGFPSSGLATTPHVVDRGTQRFAQMIDQASARLTRYTRATDRFTTTSVHLDRVVELPVMWYVLHASTMRADVDVATSFFEHVLLLASGMQRADESHPGYQQQLLADTLALPSLGWVYRPDTTIDGVDSEHWVSLWSYPHSPGTLTAFDCEDGTKALLELFNVLIGLDMPKASTKLRMLQETARKYHAWMAIGELKGEHGSAHTALLSPRSPHSRSPASYTMHCYLMLLPRDKSATPATTPAITIDSTAFASGVWHPRMLKAHARDQAEIDAQKQSIAHWPSRMRDNAHIRIPVSVVAHTRLYGALVALLHCEQGGRAVHLLMNRVDTNAFLLNPGVHTAVEALSIPANELQKCMQAELALSPRSCFPEAPTQYEACALASVPLVQLNSPNKFASVRIDIAKDLGVYCART